MAGSPPADSHDHDHAHGHHSHVHREGSKKALLAVFLITSLYMITEAVGGYLTNSLALLADAGHMFTDAAALGLSFAAMWLASRPPTPTKSFGYYRFEILATLVNGVSLIVVAGSIFWEAFQRLGSAPEVDSVPMLFIALGGLFINLFGAFILSRSAHDSLNVKGALAHVIGDALGSVAAIVAGLLMWRFGWYLADPIASALVGLLILRSAWGLVTMSVDILIQATPLHLDPSKVSTHILAVPGVRSIHDLHIWTVTSGMFSLTCHVVVEDIESSQDILCSLRQRLLEEFHIDHATIQVETADLDACHRLNW
jgi:cobalt-zinc-cadmium efflux system protein